MKVLNGTENEAPVEEFHKFCQGLHKQHARRPWQQEGFKILFFTICTMK